MRLSTAHSGMMLTSAGTLLRDLQKEMSPSAELVGLDLMAEFLPKSPQETSPTLLPMFAVFQG